MEKNKEVKQTKIVFNWNNVILVIGLFVFLAGLSIFLMFNSGDSTNQTAQQNSGLISEDIKIGEGAEAANGKTVTVNYVGTLEDGTKFDSSYDRNQPFSFVLGDGEVIKSWDMGVLGMKIGGKRKLTIPSDLGYGAAGSPPVIPPNATLVFEVELLKVE